MRLEDVSGVEVKKNFLRVRKSFDNICAGRLRDYFHENERYLTREKIYSRFPGLVKTSKKNMLFFDIETSGLSFSDPLFTISLTHLGKNPYSEVVVARDPSEERNILKYFLNLVNDYSERGKFVLFSYNGTSFDVPRVSSRLVANGLTVPKKIIGGREQSVVFKDWVSGNHVDLYPLVKEVQHQFGLRSVKLQSIEQQIFGHLRKGDVSGEKIPVVYRGYLYGVSSLSEGEVKLLNVRNLDDDKIVSMMHGVINHNLLDTFSLMSVLAFLCKGKNK